MAEKQIRCTKCGGDSFERVTGGIELVVPFTLDLEKNKLLLLYDHEFTRDLEDGSLYYQEYRCAECRTKIETDIEMFKEATEA